MRNQKTHPAPGDVVTKFGTRRTVESVESNTRAILEPSQPVFEEAAEALTNIGNRAIQRGTYIATGPELKAIRDSMDWYRALLEVTDRSHLTRALVTAAKMVDERQKQNQRSQAA